MAEEKGSDFKASWRPKFQSEFSMGEHDFARYNKTLINIDRLSGFVNSTAVPPLELMQNFFAELVNLFDNFRPLIAIGPVQARFDKLIKEGIALKRQWEQSTKMGAPFSQIRIYKFVDLCLKLKTELYSIKQVIGLGIVVRRNMTTAERIKKGIRGNASFDNLPKA